MNYLFYGIHKSEMSSIFYIFFYTFSYNNTVYIIFDDTMILLINYT